VSYKASVNALNVNGGGKLVSFPYRFTSSPLEHRTIDANGNLRKVKHGFHTRIQTMEFEAMRHFRANQLVEGKKAKWVPGWTAGFGALHYTPYATQYVRTTTGPYTWYLGNGKDVTANLRRAGTAGQNHVEGMSRYGSLALMASTGFTLSYLRPTWRLSGQIRGNITSTDYLDDFGRGTYAGGDYEAWLENLPEYTYKDPISGEEKLFNRWGARNMTKYSGSMAQNYRPDGYWQVQLSFSKDISGDPLRKYYEP